MQLLPAGFYALIKLPAPQKPVGVLSARTNNLRRHYTIKLPAKPGDKAGSERFL